MAQPAVTDISQLLEARPGIQGGRLCLRGTRITVHTVAMRYANGVTVEEMASSNSGVGAASFHAALAYYFANKDRVDAEIEADLNLERELAAKHPRAWTSDDVLHSS